MFLTNKPKVPKEDENTNKRENSESSLYKILTTQSGGIVNKVYSLNESFKKDAVLTQRD